MWSPSCNVDHWVPNKTLPTSQGAGYKKSWTIVQAAKTFFLLFCFKTQLKCTNCGYRKSKWIKVTDPLTNEMFWTAYMFRNQNTPETDFLYIKYCYNKKDKIYFYNRLDTYLSTCVSLFIPSEHWYLTWTVRGHHVK